ncbi:hypothetical protein ABT337_30250 [Saccharopolyspora hirsuta]|uniref:Uncharacterized protein n=1 Tax=Saccharopolyspora hirsuta TaxID=1837 RepID=A0A5M7BF33_SACHI|nr:hypothetical protein [Saccharopolyspora hirsuta]KAA5827057.1 hypothetical protein F1721_29145 [Saccharopolyspora hirsuta]
MLPPSRGLAGSVLAIALLLGAPALASAQTPVDCSTVQDPAQYPECLGHGHHDRTGDLQAHHRNEHASQHNEHLAEHNRHHNEHHH